MPCPDFFNALLQRLNAEGPEAFINFLWSSNNGKNPFVSYASGSFSLQNNILAVGGVKFYFSDRADGNQPFAMEKTTEYKLQISVPNGPVQIYSAQSGKIISQFSTLDCRDNGLLVCTSDWTEEIAVLSFGGVGIPIQ